MRLPFLKARQLTCPYCYAQFAVDGVAFRCAGRGKPGMPVCDQRPDARRQAVFGDGKPYPPVVGQLVDGAWVDTIGKDSVVCGSCGGASRIRICPQCHSTLPLDLNVDSPLIGMVGARNSGKTVLLSVLHTQLTTAVARRFNASIDCVGGVSGLTRDLVLFGRQMDESGGNLPQQTRRATSAYQEPAVYQWTSTNRRGKTQRTIFSFYDTAGEDSADWDTMQTAQYLSAASGMIVILDPFAFPANHADAIRRGATPGTDAQGPEAVLSNVTEVLRRSETSHGKKVKIPVAVVVSKIDAFLSQFPPGNFLFREEQPQPVFDDALSRSIHDEIASLIQMWGADGLLRKLQENFVNWRLFGVSALGHEPQYSQGTVGARGIAPLHVADPLLWIMAQQGFVDKAAQKA